MPVTTPREFMEQVLPGRLTPNKLKGLDLTFQFKITGTNGGNWFVTIQNQAAQIQEGTAANARAILKISDEHGVKLANKELDLGKAVKTGKLQIKGSLTDLVKLRDLNMV